MTEQPEVWFQCTVPNPLAARRVVCFPHAGGSASFYRDWGRQLPAAEVLAVRYPGRGERIDEPSPDDLRRLGYQIAEALRAIADRPIVLFGHSMGAVVALETARGLREQGIEVAHLFASGSRDGPLPEPDEQDGDVDDLDEAAVSARLLSLGGTDAELLDDPYFRELVLPYVVSDGRMFHGYDNRARPVLGCPVTTIAGDVDEDADRRPWRTLTEGPVADRVVPGDHFYLSANPPYDVIRDALRTTATR